MRFDRDSTEDDDRPTYVTGNRWYFFLPLALVGLWILVNVAQLVASLLTSSGLSGGDHDGTDLFQDALAVMEWLGGLGWVLLIPFYFVVLASKRASGWWVLGAFCFGPNLLFYVVLLFLPSQRRWTPGHDPLESLATSVEPAPHPSTVLLEDSFVCDHCNSLLNYGVSECHHCGQRYRYTPGKPASRD